MLKKPISVLLVFAVALVAIAPPRVFAQSPSETPAQSAAAAVEPDRAATSKAKSDLRKSLAAEVAKIKAGPLTAADVRRLEQGQQNQQSAGEPKAGWSRRKKLLVALLLVVTAGAMVVAIKHRCKAPKPCPEIDSTDYSDY